MPDYFNSSLCRLAGILAVLTLQIPVAAAASAQSQAQLLIHAPAERVWQLLVEVERWPRWNAVVQSAEMQGNFAVGSRFVWRSQGFTVTSTLQQIEVPRRLVWTGRAFGTEALHRWELEATPEGVLVRTSETFEGWLPRLMPGMMQKALDDTLPRWLTALKAAAEGEH